MKHFYFFGLAVLLFLGLACDRGPQEVVIDSFESEINPKTVDFGASENSSISVDLAKDIKVCGEQSLKMTYDLRPSGYMWVARGYGLDVEGAALWEVKPKDIKWKRYKSISVAIYGRNSGGVLAFDLKDSGGEMWRTIIDDDFEGWKGVVCPFKNFFPRKDWQPDTAKKNDKLDFPIMSFQFEPRLPGIGVYYFDCIKAVKVEK
ncbi:MAG: hypothetical protein K9L86_08370 [Candidatus Omnitrophica bacterium]|nr:hypothetical protein [Candidatus Omnitrophota bacterium]